MKLTKEQFTRRFLRKAELGETPSLSFTYKDLTFMIFGNQYMIRLCQVLPGEQPDWPDYEDIGTYDSIEACLGDARICDIVLEQLFEQLTFEDHKEYQSLYIAGDLIITTDGRAGRVESVDEAAGEIRILSGNEILICREDEVAFDHSEDTIRSAKELYEHYRSSMGFCCE